MLLRRLVAAATLLTAALSWAATAPLLLQTDDAVVIQAAAADRRDDTAAWADGPLPLVRRARQPAAAAGGLSSAAAEEEAPAAAAGGLSSAAAEEAPAPGRGGSRAVGRGATAQTVVPAGWPGLPAGVTNDCSTTDGRAGRCLPRSVCIWTRRLSGPQLSTEQRRLGDCAAAAAAAAAATRSVCCPGLFAELTSSTAAPTTASTATTSRPAGTSGVTEATAPRVTYWWQTTESGTTYPSGTRPSTTASTTAVPTTATTAKPTTTATTATTTFRPTTITSSTTTTAATTTTSTRPTTTAAVSRPSSRPPPAPVPGLLPTLPTIPPIITHPWQASSTSAAPQQTTGWWQATEASSGSSTTAATAASTTTQRPAATTTGWWQTTAAPSGGAPAGGGSTPDPDTPDPDPAAAADQFGRCGTRSLESDRIVGGGEAAQGEFPWMAGIFKGSRQFCGGSLIDRTHILTAAHCVAHMTPYDVRRLVVRLGDHDIKSRTEADHREFRVSRIIRHRTFSEQTLHKDIALLTLSENVTYQDNIRPICLAEGERRYTGDTVTVAGWGTLSEAGRQPSRLQKVSLTVWPNEKCAESYGPSAPGGIIGSMLCAGEPNKDSCSGDSGGPLMHVEADGRITQVGVVSWGIGCAKPQYPGVYTRVNDLLDWINRNREVF